MHGQPATMKREAPQVVFLGGFFMSSSDVADGVSPDRVRPSAFPCYRSRPLARSFAPPPTPAARVRRSVENTTCAMRSPCTIRRGTGRVVPNDHHPFLGVVRVDRARRVGYRQRVLERLAAARSDLRLDVVRQASAETEGNQRHLARCELDSPFATDSVAGPLGLCFPVRAANESIAEMRPQVEARRARRRSCRKVHIVVQRSTMTVGDSFTSLREPSSALICCLRRGR